MSTRLKTTLGVNVFVSRSHPEMIKRLMEQEIPEVYDGTVEIMSVAREAGDRTKVAVRSHNPNVDAIGTIVGRGGANIKKITSKFHPARYDAKMIVWYQSKKISMLLSG